MLSPRSPGSTWGLGDTQLISKEQPMPGLLHCLVAPAPLFSPTVPCHCEARGGGREENCL